MKLSTIRLFSPQWLRPLVVGIALLGARAAVAAPVTINFDVDADGNPINAPPIFVDTTRLTTLYSSLGVTFAGPGGNDGGAILNQGGNFGVNALSAPNFLAFNINSLLADGGIPQGPETVLFATPVDSVSIFGGDHVGGVTLQMQAFNALDQLVATDTETAAEGTYAQLSVAGSSITSVTLNAVVSASGAWVFDNLTFNPVPEPTTFALAGISLLGLIPLLARRPRRA
jgi:hypothetical protein